MSYEIIWEPRGVVKRHYGFLSSAELLAAAQVIQGDRRFDNLRYIINDFSDVDAHDVDIAAIEEFAALRIGAAFVNQDILSPVVAANELGRLIVEFLRSPMYANGHPVELFASMADARAWVAENLS